jgi:hypothetical protein
MFPNRELLLAADVLVPADKPWQAELRLRQARWRQYLGRPTGTAGGRLLGSRKEASDSPLWREHPTFSEFLDGGTGEGLDASHQTGWTALVAHLLNPRLLVDPRWA